MLKNVSASYFIGELCRSVTRVTGYLSGTMGVCHHLKTHLILAKSEPAE